jgi:ribulose-phosphate 3-epimerase
MSVICPTVIAGDIPEYNKQIKVISPFAKRIQVDLMDGIFTGSKSVGLKDVWWPTSLIADIHLMYKSPMEHLSTILRLRPSMVVIHAEADVHHMHFAAELHASNIRAGLAVLPGTTVSSVEQILHSFDHFLIFSGDLGHFGGRADLSLLKKAKEARAHHPDLEIGWDGGVNDENARQIAQAGVDVLNAGGFIEHSEDSKKSFQLLEAAIK